MHTVDGKRVQVLDPGRLNTDADPDFFNAKIIIDGCPWVGNVEIHVRASDWHRHGHDNDPAYDSVILHVVDADDAPIRRSNGEIIPQLRMPCAPDLRKLYDDLVGRSDIDLPCAHTIADLPSVYITDWLSALSFERLYDKTDRISDTLKRLNNDWEATCYVTLARALGFGINSEPFERLALSTPLMFIGKHADSIFTVEALLFGQSGLLEKVLSDSYAASLDREYRFMAHKFGLRQPQSLGWKMARMRPSNFPHRRIALLAAILCEGVRMMSRILKISSTDDAARLLCPALSGYWSSHFSFGPESPHATQSISRATINILIINAVVPLMLAYGQHHSDQSLTDRAISLLESLPPEHNSIIRQFDFAGITARDAMASQALIQLRRKYCELHKCLYCRIGHRMLAAGARRPD